MISLSVGEVAEATGGRILGVAATDIDRILVNAATTDSREVTAGTLFLAKPGEVTDGHLFVPAAFEAGALLALTEQQISDGAGQPYPQVVVTDVVLAMGALARYCLAKIRELGKITVVGITGSAGKTTTKDLLAGIFAGAGQTVAPVGSYNGEVGVPLTIFRADESTRYLVIEMGADRVGNIEYLADIVKPDHGVILKVGTAHAGEFGGIDNIEQTKGELAEGCRVSLALNDDDHRVRRMISRSRVPTTYFGLEKKNHDGGNQPRVFAKDLSTSAGGCPTFTLVFPDGSTFDVASKLIGEHHVYNLLAAATVAYQVGIEGQVIARKLNTLGAVSRWRMERTDRVDGVTIINDAYNANPESMAAALRTLAQLGRSSGRRTWAVLGAMLELGDVSVTEHDRLGQLAVRMNIEKLVVVGQEAKPIYNAAHLEGSWGKEATWVCDSGEAFDLLRSELMPGDIVLFKSSNGVGLGRLGEKIARLEPPARGEYETSNAHWLSVGGPAGAVDSEFGNESLSTTETDVHSGKAL